MASPHSLTRGVPLRAILLAAGVVLSSATQWRLGGTPLGPGEILLALWLLVSFVLVLSRGRIRVSPVGRLMAGFWGVAFIFLLAGWLVSLQSGLSDMDAGWRDVLAFAFVALLTGLLVLEPDAERELEAASGLVLVFSAMALSVLYLSSLGFFSIPSTSTLFGEVRFRGWAKNPNQIAILVLMIPFFGVRLLERSRTKFQRIVYLGAIGMALVTGIATRSEALFVGWLAAGLFLTAFATWRWLGSPGKSYWGGFAAYILAPACALVLLAVVAPPVARTTVEVASEVYDQEAQGAARFALWANGVRAMAASPLVGLGPGAYSGLSGPFLHHEAHNSFIDWGMSTGLLGLLAYLLLLERVMARAWRRDDLGFVAGLGGFVMFSLFHHVLRHPIFWFSLILVAGDGKTSRRAAPAALRRDRSVPTERRMEAGSAP